MLLIPDIQVGPLGGLAFWAVLILAVLAVIGGVTTGGMIAFVLIGVFAVIVLFFAMQRLLRRLGGATR